MCLCKFLIGKYLLGWEMILVFSECWFGNGYVLIFVGVKENNFKDIIVKFLLGKFICVIGVFGFGKLILVN